MPELPDVEGFRRVLADHGRGRRIERVRVLDAGVLRGITARRFSRALAGRRFAEPDRVGKWLLARTDGPTVLLHFGMTGRLVWQPGDGGGREARHRHDRVIFELDDGELRYRDMRKLQGLRLADDGAAVTHLLAACGPDALAVTRRDLARTLGGSRRQLKALLLDQGVIAGLGNLTVDEILWRAGLNPSRRAGTVSAEENVRLHRALRQVLRASVRVGRVPDRRSWLTGARDRPDARCPRCETRLCRGRRAGRTTVWCPRCQPEAQEPTRQKPT